jgi:pentatricopeptide repeat protein
MLPLTLWFVLVAGVFCDSLPVANYEFSENMAEALQRGNHLFKTQNVEEALIKFENVVLMDPTNVKGLTGIMQCYLRLGELGKARDMLDEIRRYSTNANLLNTLTKHMDEAERLSDQMAGRVFFSQQMSDFENATDPKPPPETNTPIVLRPVPWKRHRLGVSSPRQFNFRNADLHLRQFLCLWMQLWRMPIFYTPTTINCWKAVVPITSIKPGLTPRI